MGSTAHTGRDWDHSSTAHTGRDWDKYDYSTFIHSFIHSASTISQSSATSGSLATGTGGVVGLAAGDVEGDRMSDRVYSQGNAGTLVSPAIGVSSDAGYSLTVIHFSHRN